MELRGLSDLVSFFLEPEGDFENGFLYGRFNPPSNNHIQLVDYVAEKHNLEEITISVVESGGSPRNPMFTNEVIDAFERTYDQKENYYEVSLETHEIENWQSILWGDTELPEDSVYYTADLQHGVLGKMREIYSNNKFNTDYEPRYRQKFQDQVDIPNSGTKVRETIKEDSGWEKLVPKGTIAVIEENPNIKERIENGNPSRPGKHLEVVSANQQ